MVRRGIGVPSSALFFLLWLAQSSHAIFYLRAAELAEVGHPDASETHKP